MLFKIVIEKTNKYILRIEKIMIQSGIKVTVQLLSTRKAVIACLHASNSFSCMKGLNGIVIELGKRMNWNELL